MTESVSCVSVENPKKRCLDEIQRLVAALHTVAPSRIEPHGKRSARAAFRARLAFHAGHDDETTHACASLLIARLSMFYVDLPRALLSPRELVNAENQSTLLSTSTFLATGY